MDNFNDIKQVWRTANVSTLPKAEEIVKTIKKYRLNHTIKSIGLILLTLTLLAIMIWVVFDYQSNLLTTRLGEACFLLALFILLSFNATTLKRISRQKTNNKEFILYLKQEQARLIRFQQRTQVIGFAIASLGLILYLYEWAHIQKASVILLVYSVTIAWLLFNWLVIRPRAIRKKTLRLRETIKKLEGLSRQLSEN